MSNSVDISSFYNEAFKARQLGSLTIEVTSSCNFLCRHCYVDQSSNNFLEYETIIGIIDEARDLGVLDILFTGGEILLRDDILEIVTYAREKHIRVSLMSNSSLLTEDFVKSLSNLYISEFSTTLFSLDNEKNDFITRSRGSTHKIMKSLELLEKYKIPTRVKVPLLNINGDDYSLIEEYCNQHGFTCASSPVIFPRKDKGVEPLEHLTTNEQLSRIITSFREKDNDSFPIVFNKKERICKSLQYSLAIDSSGKVFPCNSFFYEVGNIFNDSLKNIWLESSKLREVQDMTNEQLNDCNDCIYNVWCSFCPGISFGENNSFLKCSFSAKRIAEVRYKCFGKEVNV